MHYPVFKIGCKNFTLYRLVYNKGDGFAGLLSAAVYFIPQGYQITFEICFKSQCIDGIALITAATVIGIK